ncbi:hypothetical protein JYU34_000865 [Plutella xylostella]|uniref:Uncharacterized protein n=1 Tax=Plutella xylostella TaxID=51655 RepID=A0ABQ7R5I8_PLUXY|nr:hypothetical protein JYU34_000865 [Plutella xylostella]
MYHEPAVLPRPGEWSLGGRVAPIRGESRMRRGRHLSPLGAWVGKRRRGSAPISRQANQNKSLSSRVDEKYGIILPPPPPPPP